MHVQASIKGLGIDPLKEKVEDDDDGKDKGQKAMKGSVVPVKTKVYLCH